jgi:hypothetical protein
MNGKRQSKARLPGATNAIGTERVPYLPRSGLMVWSRQDGFHTVLETPNGVLAQHDGWHGAVIAPSPDGKYVAVAGSWPQFHLWVYDIDLKKWADLGEADIHPDRLGLHQANLESLVRRQFSVRILHTRPFNLFDQHA